MYMLLVDRHAPTDLQAGVNGEGASCGVHAGHILSVVDILQ